MPATQELGRGGEILETLIGPVDDRIDLLLSGGTVNAEDVTTPDKFRVVTTSEVSDPHEALKILPDLDDRELPLIDFYPVSDGVWDEVVTVNGKPVARQITPKKGSIPLYMRNEFTAKYFHGDATSIKQLIGNYDGPDYWDPHPGTQEVAVTVVDFKDGSSKIFFPTHLRGHILTEQHYSDMVEQLGVQVPHLSQS